MNTPGRGKGDKRGWFRRPGPIDLAGLVGDKGGPAAAEDRSTAAARPDPDAAADRRPKRSGDMFRRAEPSTFEDSWSSSAWAEDGWDDDWSDPSTKRASVRPAADPRPEEVDAWLESESSEFADVTRDIAEKWGGRNNDVHRTSTPSSTKAVSPAVGATLNSL